MPTQQTVESGKNKYYVVERGDVVLVERAGWLLRRRIGEAHDVEEAYGLIRSDSGSRSIHIRQGA